MKPSMKKERVAAERLLHRIEGEVYRQDAIDIIATELFERSKRSSGTELSAELSAAQTEWHQRTARELARSNGWKIKRDSFHH